MDQSALRIIAEWAFWGYALAAAGYALLVTLLFVSWRMRGQRVPAGRCLIATAAICGVWAMSAAASLGNFPSARVTTGVLEAARIAAWLLLVVLLLEGPRRARVAGGLRWTDLPPLVKAAAAVVVFRFAVEGIAVVTPAFPTTVHFGAQVLASIVLLMLVEQLYRSTSLDDRWSIKFFCVGVAGLAVYDLATFTDAMLFRRVDPELWAARGFINALTIPLVAVSAARNPQWSLDLAVSRRMVFQSTALLGAGAYLLVVSAAGYYIRFFGGSWGGVLQTTVLFAALVGLVLVLFSGSLRAKVKVFINKNFFSYRYDYREEWLRITHELTADDANDAFGERAIRAIGSLVEARGGSLWVRQDTPRYEHVADWETGSVRGELVPDASLAKFLQAREWIVNLDEYRASPDVYESLTLPDWLDARDDAWLVVPLLLHNELFGFIVLMRARTKMTINWEVNDLLKTAGRQVASVLAQLHANRALLVARQFDSFNRMSAFVVHDLKNLVAQLSLLLSNAAKHRDNPEFQDDMLDTVDNAVDKMKRLLMQLRVGATPPDQPIAVDLQDVVLSALKAKAPLVPKPNVLVDAPGIRTLAHRERLDRVVGHLLQNAAEATPSGGRIEVRVKAENESAIIEVEDTGVGMSEDFIRTRLFRPFESTKKNGMGIGIYESREYIRELGGRLEVLSRETEGTCFSIALPLLRPAPIL